MATAFIRKIYHKFKNIDDLQDLAPGSFFIDTSKFVIGVCLKYA